MIASEEFHGVDVLREGKAAWLCTIDGEDYWVPKSQIRDESSLDAGYLVVTRWWADRMSPEGPSTGKTTHDDDFRSHTVRFTKAQSEIVRAAVIQVRMIANDPEMSEERALELVCADFLAGGV